jgi:ABC-2 type transport system permease protein
MPANRSTTITDAVALLPTGYVTVCLLSIGSIALAPGLLLPRSVEALGISIGLLIGSAALDNVPAVHDIVVILPVHYWLRWTQLFGGDVGQLLPGLAAQAAAIAVALTAAYALLMWRDPAA